MEETPNTNKRKFDFKDYGTVVGFLCLEVLAFISFYLGHSFLLYGILSTVLAILLVIVTFRQIKKDGITTYLFFLFPLLIFGILTALNGFNYYSIGAIGMADSIFVPIGLTLIGLAGFLTSYIKTFKIKYAILVIYVALGLFVLINLFITMIYYVPFYTIIYKNSYIFYNGHPSVEPIGSMAYMLYGFQVKEVSLLYWTLFPALLLTACIPLFFIKFKENKRDFLIYAGLTLLAFISLLFTISKFTLIVDAITVMGIAIIVVAAKFTKSRQILNIAFITIGVLFLLFLIVLFLNAQTSWGFTAGLRKLTTGNSLLNRLFNSNRYSSKVFVIFQDLFTSFKLFGCPVGGSILDYPNGVAQALSGIWLFDNLMSSGLFGAIFFMAALVISIRRMFKYISKSDDEDFIKYSIAAFVLGFLVISLIAFDDYPLINSEQMSPFYTCAPLMIVIFLLGYTFNKSLSAQPITEKKTDEVVTKEEEQDEEIISL